MPQPLSAINDFVVKFANVNGSGSASANRLFARAVLRMGVPVAARNIFPSNIQGLPTWFEVRVCEDGHRGRRGGVDLMVQMNPQTWDKDSAELEPGGVLLYDSTKPLAPEKFRSDVTVIGVPLTALCAEIFPDSGQRLLLKNIAVVGVLAGLLGIDPAVLDELIVQQYAAKNALLEANRQALRLGLQHSGPPIGLRLRPADRVGDRIFLDGNQAAALGCVYGGATVAAWYPITPSTSIAESFQGLCRRLRREPGTGRSRYAILQAEDELSAIGMVIGAAWNGARAFTATSGPGISLMQEFLGLAYFAEVPAVIIDVQRGGPSTGMPTRTQQADVLACAYASHGDTRHVLLFPEDPRECFEMAATALDLADRLQTPVFVLSDLDIGMNEWLCAPLDWDDARAMDRGKVVTAADLDAGIDFARYRDVDGDGIPWRSWPGSHPTRGAYFTRGSSKDETAKYTEDGAAYLDNMQRLLRKWQTAKALVPPPVLAQAGSPTRVGVIHYGSSTAAVDEAVQVLARQGVAIDGLRLRSFPFSDSVAAFVAAHDLVFVVEQNRDGQMRHLLIAEAGLEAARLVPVLHYDGTPITARFVVATITDHLAETRVVPLRKSAS
jgi:2-oxoglutarate ferredoxin oxidoreductase subunit alpha